MNAEKFKFSLAADHLNFHSMQSGPVTEKDYETLVLKLHEIQVNFSTKALKLHFYSYCSLPAIVVVVVVGVGLSFSPFSSLCSSSSAHRPSNLESSN